MRACKEEEGINYRVRGRGSNWGGGRGGGSFGKRNVGGFPWGLEYVNFMPFEVDFFTVTRTPA